MDEHIPKINFFYNKIVNDSLNKLIIAPAKIEIAVVGDQHVGKKALIKYWLCSGKKVGLDTITVPNMYSKILQFNNEPIQINIYRISRENYLNRSSFVDKFYHTVIYVYDLKNKKSRDNIFFWFDIMKNYRCTLTYQTILALTLLPENNIILDPDRIFNSNKFFSGYDIDYKIISITYSKKLWELLQSIINKSYNLVKNKTQDYSNTYFQKQFKVSEFIENLLIIDKNLINCHTVLPSKVNNMLSLPVSQTKKYLSITDDLSIPINSEKIITPPNNNNSNIINCCCVLY